MAESTECKQGDLNTFKEDIEDSKTVQKEAISMYNTDNDLNSSIALDIDEDIANIQAEAVIVVANSIKNNVVLDTGDIKQSNLEVEAALNNAIARDLHEATSSGVPDSSSGIRSKLAAHLAQTTVEDSRLVIAMGEELMETMSATIDVLKSHIGVFAQKAVEARGRGTERGFNVSDFYTSLVSRYEAAVAALQKRALSVQIAMQRVKECVDECMKYSGLAESITDEEDLESRQIKFHTCWWSNKGRASIIVTLKKERAALLMMRRMWLTVQDDMEYEDLNRTAEESDEETQQQCQNRDQKTKIGHIATTILGLGLISITGLFKAGSDSFIAILVLGLLTTVWCVVYWSFKLYKCLKAKNDEETIETERPQEDRFLQNCEKRLLMVKAQLRIHGVVMDSDTESDTASEAATGDDSSR